VDGRKVDNSTDREYYFSRPDQPAEMKLEFMRDGKAFETRIHPVASSNINNLLYDEWIDRNQKLVDSMTDNKIAYVYLKNMAEQSLSGFLIEMTSEAVDRKGLIIDLRYNTGGNIHDDLLNFLSQKPYLEWKFRDGQISPQPHFAPAGKPMVILVNDKSLSDAEMTSAGFKALKLGTVVGTETYRWIIFTSAKGFVDGSTIRLPAWGCYTLDGKDLESEGVKPDVLIRNTFLDRLTGKDPQLEKAIEVILKQINN
jgi:tricorn protease